MTHEMDRLGSIAIGFLPILALALAFGFYLNAGLNTTNSIGSVTNYVTSDTSQLSTYSLITPTTDNGSQWVIIAQNITIHYEPACAVYETFRLSCPTVDTMAVTPMLNNVEIIRYQD